MKLDHQDRARGMLVGLAVGDALGAPVEFLPEPSDVYIAKMGDEIAHFHKNIRLPEGVFTDDTEMALCIADSLLALKGYDSYDIMTRFVAWCDNGYRTYDSRPATDVGLQTLRAIEDFKNKPIIFENGTTDSAGNGAIMRLAPIIIASSTDVKATLEMAILSCRETHNSEVAEIITKKFAETLLAVLDGDDKEKILKKARGTEFDIEIDRAVQKDATYLSNLGGYIVDTFTIALWGLLNFDNFKDGMMAVIRLGGDTDTNGACYGQLAGAYYGYDAIPEEWRKGVYLADELVEIADRLLGLSKCPVLRTRFYGDKNFAEP